MSQGKREFVRSSIGVRITLLTEEGRSIEGYTSVLSMNGMYILCQDPLPESTKCRVRIELAGLELDDGISLGAHVVRQAPEGMALAIDEIPLDSFEHLRNLVRFNSDNLDQLEKELAAHAGIRRR